MASQAPPNVPPAAAKELLDQQGYTLIDVRTPEEYAQGAVAGSVNIPVKLDDGQGNFVDNLQFQEQVKVQVSVDTAVVCSCAHGRRGGLAAEQLAGLGFKKVVNLEGGLASWYDAQLPVEGTIKRHH